MKPAVRGYRMNLVVFVTAEAGPSVFPEGDTVADRIERVLEGLPVAVTSYGRRGSLITSAAVGPTELVGIVDDPDDAAGRPCPACGL